MNDSKSQDFRKLNPDWLIPMKIRLCQLEAWGNLPNLAKNLHILIAQSPGARNGGWNGSLKELLEIYESTWGRCVNKKRAKEAIEQLTDGEFIAVEKKGRQYVKFKALPSRVEGTDRTL